MFSKNLYTVTSFEVESEYDSDDVSEEEESEDDIQDNDQATARRAQAVDDYGIRRDLLDSEPGKRSSGLHSDQFMDDYDQVAVLSSCLFLFT